MKKILFVIGVLSNGGAERVISILSKEISSYGHSVDIITIYDDKNDYLDDKNISIFQLNCKIKNKIIKPFEIIFKIRRLIKKRKPDVIISFVTIINIYTILAKLFLKIPLIISERNDPFQNPENKYIRKIRDRLYTLSNGFVFQTEDAKSYFSDLIQKKGVIISNPISSNLPYWDYNNTENVIITACRLVKQKNLPLLIKAFVKFQESFPEYKLKIYGEGPLRADLEELIKKLGMESKVSLPGFSKHIHSEMKKSSMFVITSDYEGISNAMLEALAIGVPVISTNSPIGGAKKFIEHGKNGFLVKVGDMDGIVKYMKIIASNKSLACEISNESKKIRSILSSKNITKNWIEYIEKVSGEEL